MSDQSYQRSPRQTMDFFEHQDRAKSRTRKFVLLYIISVIAMCVAVAGVAFLVVYMNGNGETPPKETLQLAILASLATGGITAFLIAGGSAYRIIELRGGGSSVALALGGTQIDPSSTDHNERQVLNVVEEMSIASGVPVPPVYLMTNERGINAFAAGYSPSDAVIGVTRGCIEGLKRDELQGVIAHEFSHILNGDMRLNIRMIGFLNGILLLTIVGRMLLEVALHSGRRSRNSKGNNTLPILGIGIALLIIGSIGALAARLIQASVSRQREFLADASAVQFTRNPTGIANALRRLGAKPKSSKVTHPRAQESNHMFFGESYSTMTSNFVVSNALASHPPLGERIKRIDPSWDGTMLPSLLKNEKVRTADQESLRSKITQQPTPSNPFDQAGALLPLLALSGTMTPAHIDHAREIIEDLPSILKDAARDISSSRAVVYALLLDRGDEAVRTKQLDSLKQHADPAVARLTDLLSTPAQALEDGLRLPLLDMTLASLAHLSDNQHQTFRANVKRLVEMDRSIDLFEWVTMNTLTRHLDQRFGLAKPQVTQYYALRQLGTEVSILLSAIARAGGGEFDDMNAAFTLGARSLTNTSARFLDTSETGLGKLDSALTKLATCSPKLKPTILRACALTAGADRKITTTEAELLRAIADALGVPTPPLLPGQQLA